jgi:LPXTG-motif cell wall-anchored protein
MVDVVASLEQLNGFIPAEVQLALDAVLATVNQAVTDAGSQLNDALADVETQVEALLAGTVPPGTPLDTVLDEVGTDLPDVTLPTVPNLLGTSLVTATALESFSSAERTASGVESTSAATLSSIGILNGFISTDLIEVGSHSESDGATSSNSSVCNIANARIGDVAGVSLDGTNLFVDVNGEPVALPVSGAEVAAVKAQVDSLLEDAGISVELCDAVEATKNGAAASQSVSAFKVTIDPKVPAATTILGTVIPAGESLGVKIIIDPTVTTQVSAAPASAAAAQLPRTGATTAVTMGLGLAIMSTAVVLRRRAAAAVRVRQG